MFWDKFVQSCNRIGKAPNVVASEIGIKSSGSVTGWKNGASPRPAVLLKIAQYFDKPVDYFLDESSAPSDDELHRYLEELKNRPEMRMLFKLSSDCTKAEVEQAVRIIEALRKHD